MYTLCLTHRILLAAKVLLPWIGILIAAIVFAVLPAEASPLSISGTGKTLISNGTNPVYSTVSAQADLSITPSGTNSLLKIVLNNTSPTDTKYQAEALSSFYFDIVRGGVRPTVNYYVSADGPLYQLSTSGTDVRNYYTPQKFSTTSVSGTSDLRAFKTDDGTWQFKTMTPTVSPFLGFGIGTVGNSNFPSVNAFKGNWVSGPGKGQTMIDFSIYRSTLNGDITPGNALDGRYLLKNSGTFTFELAGAWTENDIRKEAVFGFGTAPDGTIFHLPEPSTYAMAVVGLAALACRQRFRRMGRGQRVPAA